MSDALFYAGIVLRHTPLWAYAVLTLLVILGLRRLGDRSVSLSAMALTPMVFFCWSVIGAIAFWLGDGGWAAIGLWPVCVLAGLGSFRLVGPPPVIWLGGDRFSRPGTAGPLLVYLGVFFFRYGLEIWAGFHPERRYLAHALAVVVSGFMAGRTLGDLWFAVRQKTSR